MVKYRSFFIKLVIFIVLVAILDQIVGLGFDYLRKKTIQYNPEFKTLKPYYVVEKMNTDIVIIGASTASRHYIPKQISDSISMSVYNCGLDGCYLLSQCCLINTILDRYTPMVVLWEIGEQSLSPRNDEYDHVDYFFPYYTNKHCKLYINAVDKYQKYCMFSKMYQNNSDIDKYLQALLDKETFDHGYWPLPNNGKHPVNLGKDKINNLVDENKLELLDQTLFRLQDAGVKVLFVQSPQYHDGVAKVSASYQELLSVAYKHNIPFMNYSNAIDDSLLFSDAEHMNEKGARVFMDMFIPSMKTYLR